MTEQEIAKLRVDILCEMTEINGDSPLQKVLIKCAELCTEAINMRIHLEKEKSK